MKSKTLDDVRLFTRMVADKQGWEPSRDPSFYEDLCTGLESNWNRYGYFLCPCRDSAGSREKDQEVICPCTYAQEDIEEYGHCYCSLYWSKDFAKSGKSPSGIPDRDRRD